MSDEAVVNLISIFVPLLLAVGAYEEGRRNDQRAAIERCDELPPFEERTHCRRLARGVRPDRFRLPRPEDAGDGEGIAVFGNEPAEP